MGFGEIGSPSPIFAYTVTLAPSTLAIIVVLAGLIPLNIDVPLNLAFHILKKIELLDEFTLTSQNDSSHPCQNISGKASSVCNLLPSAIAGGANRALASACSALRAAFAVVRGAGAAAALGSGIAVAIGDEAMAAAASGEKV